MTTQRTPSALLVSMPWTSLTEPSLGLGILNACLKQAAVPCRVLHLNLFLLEHIRPHTYYALANVFSLNDFLFSGVLDPAISLKQRNWLRLKTLELLSFELIDQHEHGGIDGIVDKLIELRQDIIPNWLGNWADDIAASDATLVGFTCMFDQTIASLALAHLVRQRNPNQLLVLGGYAVRSPTGEAILRSFGQIDAICTGEGEPTIVALARASVGEIPLPSVPNIFYRDDGTVRQSRSAPLVDMNTVPVPDYGDFFADLARLAAEYRVEIEVDRLPIENSRGCWWGATKHCVFCGIHDEDMRYRFREAQHVLHNMAVLSQRYNNNSFRFSDYILPHQYYKTLLPALADLNKPYRITSEMKANVNREQFIKLAAGGFDEVQPGIESFSSVVLQHMDKGVTAIQNVSTLLLGKRTGIDVRYNLLYGLPNDDEQEAERILELLPLLFHLEPPSTCLQIQVTRYAPLQTDPARFGIAPGAYEPSYDLIFSQTYLEQINFNLNEFCYYFERTFENSVHLNRVYKAIDELVIRWKNEQANRRIELRYEQINNQLLIFDSRTVSKGMYIQLTDTQSAVYLQLLEPIHFQSLLEATKCILSSTDLMDTLAYFTELGLVYSENNRWIALAYQPIDVAELVLVNAA